MRAAPCELGQALSLPPHIAMEGRLSPIFWQVLAQSKRTQKGSKILPASKAQTVTALCTELARYSRRVWKIMCLFPPVPFTPRAMSPLRVIFAHTSLNGAGPIGPLEFGKYILDKHILKYLFQARPLLFALFFSCLGALLLKGTSLVRRPLCPSHGHRLSEPRQAVPGCPAARVSHSPICHSHPHEFHTHASHWLHVHL